MTGNRRARVGRPTRMRPLVAIPLALALAACADPNVSPRASGSPSPSAHTYAPNDVVLRVSYEGGLLPPGRVPVLPAWVLYGDGRVITEGPVPAIYPGPAMPNLRVTRVDAATVERLADEAYAAGVDNVQRDYGQPPIADAGTAVIRLVDEHGDVTIRVYALSEAEGTGLTEEQRAARKRLKDFVARLTDGSLGPDGETYEPTAVAVYAKPYARHDDGMPTEVQVVAWRGADPAAGTDEPAGSCTVVTGATLATVLPDLRRSNTLTKWTYGGKEWSFGLRPLLPDEKDCP